MTFKLSKLFFLLLIVSLPIVRPFNFYYSGLQIPYTDLIFIASFIFWIAAVLKREAKIQYDNIYFFLGFYALAFAVSTVLSVDPSHSFLKFLGEIYLMLLAVLTLNLVQDGKFLKHIVFAWLIGTGVTVLGAILGFALFYLGYKTQSSNYFLSHFGSLPAGNYPRIRSFFANANMMCDFLNVSLMLVLLAGKLNWIKNPLSKTLQAGIWFSAFLTFSAGLGGMILSTAVWYFALLRDKQKQTMAKIILVSGLSLAVLFLGAALISPDTANTDQELHLPLIDKKVEVSVRVLVWESAIKTFLENPIFGKGTGTDAALVFYETLDGTKQALTDAHNMWLNILAQSGLFGLTAFVCLVVYVIRKCRYTHGENTEEHYILLCLSCAFLGAFLYQGLTVSYEDARHLWILIGLIIAASKYDISKVSI